MSSNVSPAGTDDAAPAVESEERREVRVIGPGLQHAYNLMPVPIQTALLNTYGLHTRRVTARYEGLRDGLRASESWSVEQQRQYVAERLRVILGHAIRYVPRYKGLAHLLPDLEAPNAHAISVLGQFPRITRAEVLEEPSSFLSVAFNKRHLVSTVTSGTTGTPMKTFLEPSVLHFSDALWWRRTDWAGYDKNDWIARLVGDHVVPLSKTDPSQPYRVSHTDRRIYLSTFHLNVRTAGLMKQVLEERRPAFLQGYPSALAALSIAGPCDREWQPKAVLYSSEPLYEHQRAAILEFVDAPIRGLYGCAERVVSAAECAPGSLHLSLLDGYVQGQFGEPCEPGPTLITGLLNRAMPLIRFELGDSLQFRPSSVCPCGRTLPVLLPVVTKAEDNVVTGSGRVISPSALTWAFKDLPGLKKSQIVQHRDLSLEVRVVAGAAEGSRIASLLERRLKEMTFGELPVKVVEMADLELTAAGKSRFVVSEIQPSTFTTVIND
jgi:phenylacetate-coenzyme A ligase PaaK-like adenylate-forming protein